MSKENLQILVGESLRRLEGWIDGHGWEGWDPYDLRGKGLFRKLLSIPLVSPKVRFFAFIAPYWTRQVFRVEKRVYPEAMAAFAQGYLALFSLFQRDKHLEKAISCLNWLKENSCEGQSHFCWGAAFDWDYDGLLIPEGTPDSTATSMAARAFLNAYRELGEESYLRIAESACEFLLRGLNVDFLGEGKLCFSYTPLDSTHVHNANLLNASILALVGKEVENQEFVGSARKAMNYTVGEQNSDGSWYYRGSADSGGRHIDNYHTGFVLRNLCYLYEVLGDEMIEKSLLKGYDYYARNLFSDSIPKLTPEKLYPIDIYSCAEAILCLATLGELSPEALETASSVAEWTIENMQDRSGCFYYRRYRMFAQRFPFVRWGQAIMLEALSHLLRVLEAERPD